MTIIGTANDGFSDLAFVKASGAYCWTADGKQVIDLVCGQGPVILGHDDAAVSAAVQRQLARGVLLPGRPPQLDELADLVLRHYRHHEEILLFKTGSEAVTAAIRLARAKTRRTMVLRVGFLGWHDQLVSPYVRCHSYDENTFQQSWPAGVPHSSCADLIDVWHGADPTGLLEVVERHGHELAALVLDPVQLRPAQARQSLALIKDKLAHLGALLIIDESKTGFRVHLGGAQAFYGVQADVTILGKALANGFPLAAVVSDSTTIGAAAAAQIKGTFRYELVSMAASIATLGELARMNVPQVLQDRGASLISALNETFRHSGYEPEMIQAVPYHWPSMPFIRIPPDQTKLAEAYQRGMIARGVVFMRDHMNYVCAVLSDSDIEAVALASADTLRALNSFAADLRH
jgi:glutamate-1-semialdehyde 2,1-aminomutase